ncbi:hypothetical protein [Nisaea nitritireducens]|uniref:hypothetical protein n=1 Tax=Nisaea nitritireducens TaxID=568392 RepID=UPI0018687E0F|nr:hypothetical protein [Nisaea nitritireducens]
MFLDDGRVGGGDAPVRFQLLLKKAAVHVVMDSAEVLKVVASSVRREPLAKVEFNKVAKTEKSASGSVGTNLSSRNLNGEIRAAIEGHTHVVEEHRESGTYSSMKVVHKKCEDGYAFIIESKNGSDRLSGQPWPSSEVMMKIKDSRHKREIGESPDPRIEIRCLREDIIVQNIRFTNDSVFSWKSLTRNKKTIVEQYIKDELFRLGYLIHDISNPYETLKIADVTPSEEG